MWLSSGGKFYSSRVAIEGNDEVPVGEGEELEEADESVFRKSIDSSAEGQSDNGDEGGPGPP